MKKTAILILVALQFFLLSFADGGANANLSEEAELLQKIIRGLKAEQSLTQQGLSDDAANLKSIIKDLEEKSPRVPPFQKSSESIPVTQEQKKYAHFVTGIRGDY